MARKTETTGRKAAKAAASTLSGKRSPTAAKRAAGSALAQSKTKKKTSKKSAKAAGKTLSRKGGSKAAKAAAASALTQRPGKRR